MKIPQFILIGILSVTMIYGQGHQTDSQTKTEIKKLQLLTGQWKGSGWILGEDQKKHEFRQSESVVFKLDSTAILVEGLGEAHGTVIHDALAIITYNPEDQQYNFRSYLASGREGTYPAEIIDENFYWYPNENMRYIISLNEDGQWYETGEIKHGGNWFQSFEMTLDRLDN